MPPRAPVRVFLHSTKFILTPSNLKQESMKNERFEARQTAGSGTWVIYDNMRKVSILKTVSPNAIYNESVVKETVEILNKNTPKTH